MKKALNWIAGLFRDEKGNPSSKRFVGIIAGLTLCITMYVNSYTHGDIKPSDALVDAVMYICIAALIGDTGDKFSFKKKVDE